MTTVGAKNESGSQTSGAAEPLALDRNFYWVGKISCENPVVLTDRYEGVRGGRHAGPIVKFVSKL